MDPHPTVLVVEDRSEVRALVASELEEAGFRIVTAPDGQEAWRCFRREDPDVVVSDVRMPRADGIDLLRRIRAVSRVPVILLTAYGDVPTAVSAMKGGAQEFLTFPDDLDRMIDRVRALAAGAGAGSRADRLDQAIVGRSAAARSVRERVVGLAPLAVPVVVCGEPGTGRDRVVHVLHGLAETPLPLQRIACDTPAGLQTPREDVCIYLDAVPRLPADAQRYWFELLRRSHPRAPRVARVFASSTLDLRALAREGRFHAGLAEELMRFTIQLPALRDRTEDVPDLAAHLLQRLGRRMGREEVHMQPAALALLRRHDWPGNVRELAETLERLVAFCADGVLTPRRVQEVLGRAAEAVTSARDRREHQQRRELVGLLEECGGNLAEVARRLGVSRGAVIYRAHKYGLLSRPKPR